jgi:hypothetical protein
MVGDRAVTMKDLVYSRPTGEQRLDISSRDVVAEIRKRFPDFSPCAYLNGTEDPTALKWLLTTYVGTPERVLGYAGPRFLEVAQGLHHLRNGRYMAYAAPSVLRHGRAITAAGALLDKGLRETWRRSLGWALRHPWKPFPKLHLQSVMMIQPIDVLSDGRLSMCDGCPDITVHEGELVWSCRLEERIKYGAFASRAVPKEARETVDAPEPAPETEPVHSAP